MSRTRLIGMNIKLKNHDCQFYCKIKTVCRYTQTAFRVLHFDVHLQHGRFEN